MAIRLLRLDRQARKGEYFLVEDGTYQRMLQMRLVAKNTCLGGGASRCRTTESQAYNVLSPMDMKPAGLGLLTKEDLG